MSTPYVGEVRLVGFNFQPSGWNFCNGALISIAENSTLFALIGTTYGGDGQQTYGLPNLQGRTPIHQGQNSLGGNYVLGQGGGVENVTISPNQYPLHTHTLLGSSNPGTSNSPTGNLPAGYSGAYSAGAPVSALTMNNSILLGSGGNQPHSNMQPYLVLNWVISFFGVFPSQD
jgi:microcystin-dependent protein